jgi:hypothetical protein
MKICLSLSVSRSIVLQMINLLDDGQDLTPQPRGRKKRSKQNERQI